MASVTAIAVGEVWPWLARLTATAIAALGVMLACREMQGSSGVTWPAIGAGLGAALVLPVAIGRPTCALLRSRGAWLRRATAAVGDA